MRKVISIFITLTLLLSCTLPAFATFSDETIIIDGKQYTIERIVSDNYSQAIMKDSSTKEIVSDFTYYLDSKILMDNLVNQTVNPISISSENEVLPFSDDDSKYVYSHTERYDFSFAEYTTVAIVAAIVALNPGVASAVIGAVVSYAVTKQLSSIYCIQDCYYYRAKENNVYYHYSKRVTSIYGDDDTLIGGPWTSYQKIREK